MHPEILVTEFRQLLYLYIYIYNIYVLWSPSDFNVSERHKLSCRSPTLPFLRATRQSFQSIIEKNRDHHLKANSRYGYISYTYLSNLI